MDHILYDESGKNDAYYQQLIDKELSFQIDYWYAVVDNTTARSVDKLVKKFFEHQYEDICKAIESSIDFDGQIPEMCRKIGYFSPIPYTPKSEKEILSNARYLMSHMAAAIVKAKREEWIKKMMRTHAHLPSIRAGGFPVEDKDNKGNRLLGYHLVDKHLDWAEIKRLEDVMFHKWSELFEAMEKHDKDNSHKSKWIHEVVKKENLPFDLEYFKLLIDPDTSFHDDSMIYLLEEYRLYSPFFLELSKPPTVLKHFYESHSIQIYKQVANRNGRGKKDIDADSLHTDLNYIQYARDTYCNKKGVPQFNKGNFTRIPGRDDLPPFSFTEENEGYGRNVAYWCSVSVSDARRSIICEQTNKYHLPYDSEFKPRQYGAKKAPIAYGYHAIDLVVDWEKLAGTVIDNLKVVGKMRGGLGKDHHVKYREEPWVGKLISEAIETLSQQEEDDDKDPDSHQISGDMSNEISNVSQNSLIQRREKDLTSNQPETTSPKTINTPPDTIDISSDDEDCDMAEYHSKSEDEMEPDEDDECMQDADSSHSDEV